MSADHVLRVGSAMDMMCDCGFYDMDYAVMSRHLVAVVDTTLLADAIARSLTEDGYIDFERKDGRDYLEGKATVRTKDIWLTAESIAREYVTAARITGFTNKP